MMMRHWNRKNRWSLKKRVMNRKTKEYREKLADTFLHVLEDKGSDWKQEWNTNLQINGITGRPYRGVNQFFLQMVAEARGYKDPRWVTFVQCKENDWRLQDAKGKGVQVEYWFPYDREEKRGITWKEFQEKDLKFDERYSLRASYKHVFNGDLVEGMPALDRPIREEIRVDEVIGKLEKEMEVQILHDGQGRAYYSPVEDKIHLPTKESFFSSYAYHSTALHELTHATGASHRLNRDLTGIVGSSKYAREELVAEITSCFLSAYLPMEQTEEHIANHKAYVKSWVAAIKKDPDVLVHAVRQAETAAEYMEEKAGLELGRDQMLPLSMEVSEDQVYSDPSREMTPMEQCMEQAAREMPVREAYAEHALER